MNKRPANGNGMNRGGQRQVTINNVNDLPLIQCSKCGGTVFQDCVQVREVSAIHPENPTGKKLYVNQIVRICTKQECREILPNNP